MYSLTGHHYGEWITSLDLKATCWTLPHCLTWHLVTPVFLVSMASPSAWSAPSLWRPTLTIGGASSSWCTERSKSHIFSYSNWPLQSIGTPPSMDQVRSAAQYDVVCQYTFSFNSTAFKLLGAYSVVHIRPVRPSVGTNLVTAQTSLSLEIHEWNITQIYITARYWKKVLEKSQKHPWISW